MSRFGNVRGWHVGASARVIIAIIGGTGPEGKGLAYRFALAGHEIIVGSRNAGRAEDAAREIAQRVDGARVRGLENDAGAREAGLVVLTVPQEAQAATLPPLAAAIGDKIVISTGVPMVFTEGRASMAVVAEGSAAEQAQALLPDARVIGAFQNLAAGKLWKGDASLDQDVIVCGDDEAAKQEVMTLAGQIAGVRPVDGGPLASAKYVEAITVLLVGVNRRYKTTAGVRVTGLP
jgi:NADPH-dependent F420 reductase